jgi:hypothetical protein
VFDHYFQQIRDLATWQIGNGTENQHP